MSYRRTIPIPIPVPETYLCFLACFSSPTPTLLWLPACLFKMYAIGYVIVKGSWWGSKWRSCVISWLSHVDGTWTHSTVWRILKREEHYGWWLGTSHSHVVFKDVREFIFWIFVKWLNESVAQRSTCSSQQSFQSALKKIKPCTNCTRTKLTKKQERREQRVQEREKRCTILI